jgi:hypothetical protein
MSSPSKKKKLKREKIKRLFLTIDREHNKKVEKEKPIVK